MDNCEVSNKKEYDNLSQELDSFKIGRNFSSDNIHQPPN